MHACRACAIYAKSIFETDAWMGFAASVVELSHSDDGRARVCGAMLLARITKALSNRIIPRLSSLKPVISRQLKEPDVVDVRMFAVKTVDEIVSTHHGKRDMSILADLLPDLGETMVMVCVTLVSGCLPHVGCLSGRV